MRVATIKSTVAAAAIAMVGLTPSIAHAGAQVDTKSLTDVLVAKGVLTKGEAKTVSSNNNDKLKLGVTAFVNLKSNETSNFGSGWAAASQGTQTKTQGVNLDRAYLTGKYFINDIWKLRVTTDVQYESGLASKKSNIFLKYAYLQGDFAPEASLRFGVIHTAWIDHEEHLWGHRYVTKTMVDDLGIEDSADAGIGLAGKILGGLANYQVAIVNGGGYGNISATKGQDISARLGFAPIKGMTIDFGYRNGYRGKKTFSAGTQTNPSAKQNVMQAMVTYGSGHDYRIGANYVVDKDKAEVVPGATTANAKAVKNNAYALWGYYNFAETSIGTLGIFGRYQHDKVTPYNNTGALVSGVTNETIQHNAIGLELKPAKGIALSLVYDNVDTKNMVSNAGLSTATTTTDKNTHNRTFGLYGLVDF